MCQLNSVELLRSGNATERSEAGEREVDYPAWQHNQGKQKSRKITREGMEVCSGRTVHTAKYNLQQMESF